MLIKGILCIWFAVTYWRWYFALHAPQIKQIYFIIKGDKTMNANVVWTPSDSAGVVSQHLTVVVNGATVKDNDVDPGISNDSFPVNPGDNVTVTVTAFDGTWRSGPGTQTVTAPTMPNAPTNVTITFVA